MKKIAKILSAGLSALMLISSSCITAGAVSEKNYNTDSIKVLNSCNFSGCSDIKSILNRVPCSGNCNIDSLIGLLQQRKACPGGNCDNVPSQGTTSSGNKSNPKTSPTKPQSTTVKPQSTTQKPVSSTSADSSFNAAYEDEVIRLVNIERAKYGLSALKKDQGAVSAARIRAKEIVQSFSHTRPDGRSCFTAAKDLGVSYSTAGENIAYGYADPQKVVNGWMNSEGHRKNILSSSFSKIGVGCYSSGKVLYWSQFFIG